MVVRRVLRAAGLLGGAVALLGSFRWVVAPQPSAEWRARFTHAALEIPFDKDLPPQRDSAVPSNANVPKTFLNVTIAAARTRDTGQMTRIDARITSDTEYPRLGIAPGVNYVWKDFVGGRMRLLIIPANPRYKTHWLAVTSHAHAPTVRVPRLVISLDEVARPRGGPRPLMLSVCTDQCTPPLSWCTAHDTTTSTQLMTAEAPVSAIARYFGRNKVAWNQR